MSEVLQNPIERKIAGGMSAIVAFLSEATCGEPCWEAREDVCRCSCGGKNHGCMRTADGIRPTRNAKIDGYRYELKAVGNDIYSEAKAINRAAGYRSVDRISDTLTYHYSWNETDKGAPARMKTASDSQIENWPELSAYRDGRAWTSDDNRKHYIDKPYLLWVKVQS